MTPAKQGPQICVFYRELTGLISSMDPTLTAARIMEEWQLSSAEMSRILGLGDETGEPDTPATIFELDNRTRFGLVLRLYQSLGALFGHGGTDIANWLRTKNLDFAMCPIDLMQTEDGLPTVCDYADSYRSKS